MYRCVLVPPSQEAAGVWVNGRCPAALGVPCAPGAAAWAPQVYEPAEAPGPRRSGSPHTFPVTGLTLALLPTRAQGILSPTVAAGDGPDVSLPGHPGHPLARGSRAPGLSEAGFGRSGVLGKQRCRSLLTAPQTYGLCVPGQWLA